MTGETTEDPARALSAVAQDLRGRGVELVLGTVVDMAGVPRGKAVPVERLPAFAHTGMGASPSWNVFCVDTGIAFTPSFGVAGDLRLRIDPAGLRVLGDGLAWAPGSFFEQDGSPSAVSTRGRLAGLVRRAGDRGLTARVGAELEFTLVAADGTRLPSPPWSPYGLRPTLERSAFLVDVARLARQAGLALEQVHAEYGAEQYEVSLPPADPVAAADAVVLARIVVGRAAARHGLGVSFSPVPFVGGAGNGAHLHLSLADADGPVLSGGDGPHGLTPTGGAAIGGVLEALPDLVAVYAGSALSAQRLRPGNWAGAAACWGLENREAAVRFCAATPGNPHGANLELKLVDPSANPYLAVAALLGSALRGVERSTPLPPEVPEDPRDAGAPLPELPLAQAAAVAALESSPVAAEVLGAAVVEALVAVRHHEITAFADAAPEDVAAALRLAWTC